jgi:hypothetical protein
MKNSTARIVGGALVLASLGALAFTIPNMVTRLRTHNREAGASLYKIEPVLDAQFEFHEEPVRVEEVRADGAATLHVHFRGEAIPVALDGHVDERLPGLVRYENSVRFLSIAAAGPASDPGSASFKLKPWRFFVAARHTPPGENPETWGAVERKKWQYEVIELLPAGSPTPEALPAPSATLTNAYGQPSSVTPVSEFLASIDAEGGGWAKWSFNMAALPDYERTIQYAAAIEVTPALHRPRNVFTNTGFAALNWTWPAAGVAVLGGMIGILLLAGTLAKPNPIDTPRP